VELTRVIDRLSKIAANLIPAGALTGKKSIFDKLATSEVPKTK
jgi:hypothetical protein